MREGTINRYFIKGKDYLRSTLAGSVPCAENNAVVDDVTAAEDLERMTAKAWQLCSRAARECEGFIVRIQACTIHGQNNTIRNGNGMMSDLQHSLQGIDQQNEDNKAVTTSQMTSMNAVSKSCVKVLSSHTVRPLNTA